MNLQHIVAYPTSHGKFINLAAFDTDYTKEDSFYSEPWIRESDFREVANLFRDWEPEVKQVISVRFFDTCLRYLFPLTVQWACSASDLGR